MAGLVVCDICNEVAESEHGEASFNKAVVRVSTRAIDRNTVTPIETVDACDQHIQTAVMSLWDAHRVVPNLHDIVIIKVS